MRTHRKLSGLSPLVLAGLLITPTAAATAAIAAGAPSTTDAATAGADQHVERTSGELTPSALAAPLIAVLCTSEERCMAVGGPGYGTVGGGGSIAATTSDGGAHWARTPLLVRAAWLKALACSTSRTCIAVGGNPAGNDVKGVAISSLDAGRSWRVMPALPKGVGVLNSVSCPTASFCMAVGVSPDGSTGVALVTSSSGQRWKRLSLPKDERGLALVNCTTSHSCIAQGTREAVSGVFDSGERLSIVTTSDGGTTWTQRAPPAVDLTTEGFPNLKGVACPSSTRCFLVGDATPGDGSPSGLVYASADGGRTWTSEPVPPGTTILNGISCANARECAVVGGGIEPRGGTDRDILTTTDSGQTWVSRPVPPTVVGLVGASCPTVKICVSAGYGLTTTTPYVDQPVVATTSDGGTTWTAAP